MSNLDSNNPVKDTWDKVAEKYDLELSKEEIDLADDIKKLFLDFNIQPGSSLLELGSGSGHLSGIFSSEGYKVSLLDFSEVALTKSKELFSKYNFAGEFIKGDITELNKLEGDYDLVWNSGVMEHFDDETLNKVLISIRSKTKKLFIFLVPNPDSIPYLLFRHKLTKDQKWVYGKEYLRSDFETQLMEAGFKTISKRYLGWKLTKVLLDMTYNSNEITEYIKQLIDNNLFPESSAYLTAYVACASGDMDFNNVQEFKHNEGLSKVEYFTERFDTFSIITGLEQKLGETILEREKETKKLINENSINKEVISKLDNDLARLLKLNESSLEANDKLTDDLNKDRDKSDKTNIELNQSKLEKQQLKFDLDIIHRSDFWKIALKYYNIRDHVWPFKQLFHFIKRINIKRKADFNSTFNSNKVENIDKSNPDSNDKLHKKELHKIAMDKYQNYDVMFFSVIDWDFRHQRPQHIARSMADQGHRVYYFNANFNVKKLEMKNIRENLNVVTLCNKSQSRIYDIDLNESISKEVEIYDQFIKENHIKDCVVFIEYPTWQPIVNYLKDKYNFKIIFDYLDDYLGFNTSNPILVECSKKVFHISDSVIASSQYLFEKANQYNPHAQIIRNGTEFNHFNKAIKDENSDENVRPIIGYFGAIAEWFDDEKVLYLAKNKPEWDFILIGDFTYGKVEELKALSNVKFLGEKDYKDLPRYIKDFDVALIPFKTDTDLIKATNPVKFYEYLSAAKKVVATEIPELEAFKNKYVYLSNDDEQFLKYVELCVSNEDELLSIEEKLKFAREQDWEGRCKAIEKVVIETHDLISIIIVTYNNLNLTKECINSILEKTAYPSYEIILVDNDSTDGTQEYLKEMGGSHLNINIILNDSNLGFAKGNNIGIKQSKGKYIVLLNNDTVVTRGWLTNFIKYFKRDSELCLLGPVTNSIGNEAKINVEYNDLIEMDWFAENYTNSHFNELYKDIDVLAMFCVVISREKFNIIGYLDENFGIGMFEDDDYSYRVKEKGYRVACAEDVFIHHYGKASFKKIKSEEYNRLFETNKSIFEEKWKVCWVPHIYRRGVN